MAEVMRATVASLLKGIDRYNPDNLTTLEQYVKMQVDENTYDLEANLAVLKLYQFNPGNYNESVTIYILLKALTNLPHTDFNLCHCFLSAKNLNSEDVQKVFFLADLLEKCQFKTFWQSLSDDLPHMVYDVVGFEDSIRKYICHVIGICYDTISRKVFAELLGCIPEMQLNQWIAKYGWKLIDSDTIFIAVQEENIKTKNIKETITLENVAAIMTMASKGQLVPPVAPQ
ncbi:eukaryotic translation initiation factor 3 subunit K-like [Octopus bimaculoides]|uniref:eukaryotic translation initiation factor 3 subunit K-like n=1 Tax=Octopus bimaculoides TaxID=37653 RepID=UPI0022E8F8D2|nr:eukaryotic translation initiation factor 3 subunit K-like [Octopus bimaculoides]